MISEGDLDVKTFDRVNKISDWLLGTAVIITILYTINQKYCHYEVQKVEPVKTEVVK